MSRQASGLRAWVLQRVSAVYLLIYFPFLVLTLASSPPADHAQWVAWLGSPGVSIGLLLFVAALLLHAWVGFRDAVIDYVHPIGARVAVLTLLGFVLVACGLWALKVVVLARVASAAI
jgi:succinate dehydrogenase / fumarate reductase membrane anchor subunit